ncbi:MAG: hypothetical protein GY796_27230 [Chloroflexi bacterium]|nr:hypothetical protein [Chloroflexota bacterium]
MDITTNQAAQNFILAYLEDHPDFLETIKQKFASTFDTPPMPMVDEDTERRIGVALAEHEAGKGTMVTSPKELTNFLDSLKEEHGIQTGVLA